jgi:hypothetical protein
MLTPRAAQISEDKLSKLMTAIEEQIKMPRFDYNILPKSLSFQFHERSSEYCSKTLKEIDSINVSIEQIEDSLSPEKRTNSPITLRQLLDQKSNLLNQRKMAEESLVQQILEIATETLTPVLFRILSDPNLQRLRAQEYISEEERNKFIVTKAKELGITSEYLEKVMNSAYLCVVVLTNYSKTLEEKTETEEEIKKQNDGTLTSTQVTKKVIIVTNELAGHIIWFKFANLEKNPHMQFLKMVGVESSYFLVFDHEDKTDEQSLEGAVFNGAVKKFVANLDLETRRIEDFRLKAGIIELNRSKVGFALGKGEGLYIGQKFLVYERQKIGDKIGEKKRGFFYVDKIGDNISKDELSYGKIVIPGAEPGMQICEFPTTSYYLGIGIGYGTAKVGPAESLSFKIKKGVRIPIIRIKKEINVPINTLNINVNYDLGRFTKIPQLFLTTGINLGNIFSGLDSSIDGIISDSDNESLDVNYISLYIGGLKKYYIHRFALYFEPLIQFQKLYMELGVGEDEYVSSFFSNVGVEFALKEDLSVNAELNIKLGTEESIVTYPKVFLGAHMTKNLSKWSKDWYANPVLTGLTAVVLFLRFCDIVGIYDF